MSHKTRTIHFRGKLEISYGRKALDVREALVNQADSGVSELNSIKFRVPVFGEYQIMYQESIKVLWIYG
jgi:hypothetical protein